MILLGDCLERLKELEENSVDAVVTDPPYGWRFMGKAWDGDDIVRMTTERMRHQQTLGKDGKVRASPRCAPSESAGKYDLSISANKSFEVWTTDWAREVFRVLKPGAHVLVFCGPRTYHRMASGVEDAGFEIRDQLQWIFGSGFPKSHNIDKAIDKLLGAEREVIGTKDVGPDMRGGNFENAEGRMIAQITKPSTPEAYRYKGWGTALKPANEPIVLARKPLEKGLTVAQNMLKWGVGGLNIDESRIGLAVGDKKSEGGKIDVESQTGIWGNVTSATQNQTQGRWPSNLLLSESAAQMLDEQSGQLSQCGGPKKTTHDKGMFGIGTPGQIYREENRGASRFFYVAKASKRERNAGLEGMPDMRSGTERMNNSDGRKEELGESDRLTLTKNGHPCVKPIKLMEYLCKLITPAGGVILDPFCGSGSTLVAAHRLGFKGIGIEQNSEYVAIAERRIAHAKGESA